MADAYIKEALTEVDDGPPARVTSAVMAALFGLTLGDARHEVMGVLFGEEAGRHCIVRHCRVLRRDEFTSDAVSVSEEALARAVSAMETEFPGERLLGWFHSHISFQPIPSEADVQLHRTYFSDPGLFGMLIARLPAARAPAGARPGEGQGAAFLAFRVGPGHQATRVRWEVLELPSAPPEVVREGAVALRTALEEHRAARDALDSLARRGGRDSAWIWSRWVGLLERVEGAALWAARGAEQVRRNVGVQAAHLRVQLACGAARGPADAETGAGRKSVSPVSQSKGERGLAGAGRFCVIAVNPDPPRGGIRPFSDTNGLAWKGAIASPYPEASLGPPPNSQQAVARR